MNKKQFKIWLITYDFTQESLAKKLGLTSRTISSYCTTERFPKVFIYALKGLEQESMADFDD